MPCVAVIISAIHVALGEAGALDFEMLERAVSAGVAESETLDWKGGLYEGPDAADEFAKDVTALANSRGGVLVIGIKEERKTSRAASINPVDLSDGLERRMRAWLTPRVEPSIGGIEFHSIRKESSGSEGVLVIRVPQSPELPHVLVKDRAMQWPYRSGTQTMWMREREIERAYRDRFERRRSEEEAMAATVEHLVDQLDFETGPWLIGVARPLIPAESYGVPPTSEDVREVVQQAIANYAPFLDHVEERLGRGALSRLGVGMHNPRPGLRRWVVNDKPYGPSERSASAHAELHHDGTVVVAQCSHWQNNQVPDREAVLDFVFNSVIIDLLNAFQANADRRGLSGGALVRLDLARSDAHPYAFITSHRVGGVTAGYEQPTWSRDVRRFIPVETAVPPMPTSPDREFSAYQLAADALAQFGATPEDMGWSRPAGP